MLAWNFGYEFEVAQVLSPAIAVLLIAVGFLLQRAERNWFVGIRTPWTLSSDEVWRNTHEVAAPLFKLTGVLAVVGPVLAVSLFAVVYSYVDYRRVGDGDPAEAG